VVKKGSRAIDHAKSENPENPPPVVEKRNGKAFSSHRSVYVRTN
jgi:hypothetical protein